MPTIINLVRRDYTMQFIGVVNVPLYEAPFNPLPASVAAGWGFSPQSSHPTIDGQAFAGTILTAFDAITLTPFVFATHKFPTATTTLTTYNLGRKPIFYFSSVSDYFELIGSPFSTYFWSQLALPAVNTFSPHTPGKQLVWNNSTIGTHVGETLQSSVGPFILAQNLRPIIAVSTIDNNANIYFAGIQFFAPAHLNFYAIGYKFAGVIGAPSPNFNVPDYVFNNNHMLQVYDVNNPQLNVIDFGLDASSSIQVASWRRLFFGNTELNNLFDHSITADCNQQGMFLIGSNGGGSILYSPHTNSLTPEQIGTVVITDMEFKKYWLINFIPVDSKARAMLGTAATSWRIARDPDGVYYFGNGSDNRTILESFGLSLPFYWPNVTLPAVSIPCPGSCVPVPLNIPAL